MTVAEQILSNAIAYTRAGERLAASLNLLGVLIDSLGEVAEVAPDAAPELRAALDALVESKEAMVRAHDYCLAKWETFAETVQ